jgi:hypothetical protein
MRRALLIPLILLAVFGCKKLGNPLNPDTDLPLGTGAGNLPTVTGIEPAYRAQLRDDQPGDTGIQATVVVTFSDYMDPDSVVKSVTATNTTTGQVVGGLATTYEPEARKLYIRSQAWPRNAAFLLALSSTRARNRWGAPLDGNRNGTSEGGPYDDALTTFYTAGSDPDSCVPTWPPSVSVIGPDTILVIDTLPEISVSFMSKMDTSKLVAASFKLVKDNGTSVALTRTSVSPQHVEFYPATALSFGHRYTFTIIESAVKGSAPANTPEYLLNLDSDNDGAEAQEPDFSFYFLCDTLRPPEVEASDYTDRFEFDFSEVMDGTTLTAANIRAFDGTGYVPGSLVVTLDGPGNATRVYYYFSRPLNGGLRAFVSRAVRSKDGVQLDGSGNGIGGEPWDDYWW